MNEAFGSLFFAMGFAILVVYIVMVLALGSLITPVHHPLQPAAGGHRRLPGAGSSAVTRSASAPWSGLLMLIGIVVTNAIVLLDFVEQRRARGRLRLRRPHRWRPRARAADPDDGHRHHAGADAGGPGHGPRLDHRRGAGHRRHRRPLQLDRPDPASSSRCCTRSWRAARPASGSGSAVTMPTSRRRPWRSRPTRLPCPLKARAGQGRPSRRVDRLLAVARARPARRAAAVWPGRPRRRPPRRPPRCARDGLR